MKKLFKTNKGFAATDALIAILIIALFTGLIATLLYNIYISNTSLKRMSKANSFIVDILEYAQKIYYSDLDNTSTIVAKYSYLDTAQNEDTPEENMERMWTLEGSPEDGYNVKVVLDKYMPNGNALDLVRKLTVTVNYKVGGKTQQLEVYTIKSRENITVPNKPDLALMQLQQNEIIYPIKHENGNYIVCTEKDSNWYQYDLYNPTSSTSAKIIISEDNLAVGDIIDENNYTMYEWVPRYAENSEHNIVFLYSNSNNYLETYSMGNDEQSYQRLIPITSEFSVNAKFGNTVGYWNEL